MFLEFKDTFHYFNGHLERWHNAIDKLNDYIQQHKREHVEIISYKVVYLPDKQFSQTCILALAVEPIRR